MNLKCKIGYHKWIFCKCKSCGKTRDKKHYWNNAGNGCKCTVCRKIRSSHHNWIGCKCSFCGKTRDEYHDWKIDCQKCSRCKKIRVIKHNWSKDCEKCSNCYKIQSDKHVWDGCKCLKCKKVIHDYEIINNVNENPCLEIKKCRYCQDTVKEYHHDFKYIKSSGSESNKYYCGYKQYKCIKCGEDKFEEDCYFTDW